MRAILIAALFFSMPAFANDTGVPQNASRWKNIQVAQDACTTMCINARTCKQRQNSMGGGTDGQAGAFYQCWVAYCGGVSNIKGCSCGAC
jgi:hypothetical protein